MTRQGLGHASFPDSIDGCKAVRHVPLWLVPATFLFCIACGKTEQKPEQKQEPAAVALSVQENVAGASSGVRAIAVSSAAPNFPISGLNDGTAAPWGAADSQDDVWAAVVYPGARPIHEFRIWLFSPDQPPRPHLRDIRVVVADSEETGGPKWRVVRSRLGADQLFSERVTVPPGKDGDIVRVEIDTSDPNYGPHTIWGFACFAASKGDTRNYLAPGTGNGIYVRELQMK